MANAPIAAPQRFVVSAPVAVINVTGIGPVYVDRGGVVPANTDPAHVQHLLSLGLIKPSE
jgi:hypothetical protein